MAYASLMRAAAAVTDTFRNSLCVFVVVGLNQLFYENVRIITILLRK